MYQLEQKQLQEIQESVAPFSRRGFLLGGASLAAGLTLTQSACSPTRITLATLPYIGEDWPVIESFTKTILPLQRHRDMQPLEQVPVFENINEIFAEIPNDIRADLSKGLSLFNYAAIILGFHFRPFTSLNETDRLNYVERWQSGNSIQRGLVWALKQIVYVSYWGEPGTWAAIGYDGPITQRMSIPKQGNSPLPAAEASAQ